MQPPIETCHWISTVLLRMFEKSGVPVVRYNLEHTAVTPVTNLSALKLKSFTVGKFAGYLSGMMVNALEEELKEDEEEALCWLLQASNDTHLTVSSDTTVENVRILAVSGSNDNCDVVAAGTDTSSDPNPDLGVQASPTTVYNRQYWAERFYAFLSKLTELKSRPKDEKGLLLFSLHVPPADTSLLPVPTAEEIELKAKQEATKKNPWQDANCV